LRLTAAIESQNLSGEESSMAAVMPQRLLLRLSSRPKENHDPQPIAGGVLLPFALDASL
jgi:hypothetical protein